MRFLKKPVSTYEEVIRNEYIFYAKHIRPGDMVLDVGANVGEMSLLFSRLVGDEGRVHSFEPIPGTYNKLNTLVEIFNLNNVNTHNVAVSDATGTIEFNVYDEKHSAWNTIVDRPLEKYGISVSKPRKESIPCTSLDDFFKLHEIERVDLVKLDVEGAELKALQGAKGLFASKKIKICLFEFGQTTFEMGDSAEDYYRFFKQYGYVVKNIISNDMLFPSNNGMAQFAIHYAVPN